jgi:hypothetical protein
MDNLSNHKVRKRERSKRRALAFSALCPKARTSFRLRTPFQAQRFAIQSYRANGTWSLDRHRPIVDLFDLDECRSYFAAAEYDAT